VANGMASASIAWIATSPHILTDGPSIRMASDRIKSIIDLDRRFESQVLAPQRYSKISCEWTDLRWNASDRTDQCLPLHDGYLQLFALPVAT
jgi:hypothetical protein